MSFQKELVWIKVSKQGMEFKTKHFNLLTSLIKEHQRRAIYVHDILLQI